MALYVTTVSANVALDDLGYTIVHPTSAFDIEARFGIDACARSESLTNAIRNGLLYWTRTSGGYNELPTDYQPAGLPDVGTIVNDVSSFEFRGPDCSVVKTAAQSASIKFNGRMQLKFSYVGSNIGTRFLCLTGTTTPSSDTVPYVLPCNAMLIGISFNNTSATANCDIEIYKNGTTTSYRVYRFQETKTKKWATIWNESGLHTFGAGDRVIVRHLNYSGGTTSNAIVFLHFAIQESTDQTLTGTT